MKNLLPQLMKREYWEHRGGFFWAPIWASTVLLTLVMIGMFAAVWHTSGRANGEIHVGVPLKKLLSKIPAEEMSKLGMGIDAGLAGFWLVLQIVLFFVLFFYLIGALYDDRRDRSILFWKSLPISDSQTVLSKVLMAAFVAPLLAWAIAVALNLGVLLLATAFVGLNGVNPMTMLWGPAEPLALWTKMLLVVPVNAIWALPAIGWLLLVSSFAKSKPFLWAVALPIAVGVVIAIFEFLETIGVPDSWYWQHVAGRILLSLVPGSWMWTADEQLISRFDKNGPVEILDADLIGSVLMSPSMWIGAVAGVAMIAGSVWFRRQRELAD
jgi:ABC-2 type transport system permease protein